MSAYFLKQALNRKILCTVLVLSLRRLLSPCTQDAPQAPWGGCDASSHLTPLSSLNLSAKAWAEVVAWCIP